MSKQKGIRFPVELEQKIIQYIKENRVQVSSFQQFVLQACEEKLRMSKNA